MIRKCAKDNLQISALEVVLNELRALVATKLTEEAHDKSYVGNKDMIAWEVIYPGRC